MLVKRFAAKQLLIAVLALIYLCMHLEKYNKKT